MSENLNPTARQQLSDVLNSAGFEEQAREFSDKDILFFRDQLISISRDLREILEPDTDYWLCLLRPIGMGDIGLRIKEKVDNGIQIAYAEIKVDDYERYRALRIEADGSIIDGLRNGEDKSWLIPKIRDVLLQAAREYRGLSRGGTFMSHRYIPPDIDYF